MDNKNIEKLLKSAKPKVEINNKHKQNLRRKLLTSEKFEKNFLQIHKTKIALSFSFTVIVLFLLLNNAHIKSDISTDELISKMQANYAGFSIPDKLNIFNSDLKIFGTENEEIDLGINRIIDFQKNNYRVILLNKDQNEVLDELIIKKDLVYRTVNPKIKIENSTFIKVFTNNDITDNSSNDSNKSHFEIFDMPNIEKHDFKYFVYSNSSTSEVEGEIKQKIKIPKETNLDEYMKTNPIDIIKNIKNKKNRIVKIKYNDDSEKNFVIMESISELSDLDVKIMLKTFSDSNHKDNNNRTIQDSLVESIQKQLLSNNKIEKVETIKVNPHSGEIVQINFSINKNGERKPLSEITFKKFKHTEKENSLFDTNTNSFAFIYKIED